MKIFFFKACYVVHVNQSVVKHIMRFCFRIEGGFGFVVFNATFKNISVISWQSVLFVEETAVPGENHQPVASH
jgi:hypothetical protein